MHECYIVGTEVGGTWQKYVTNIERISVASGIKANISHVPIMRAE